MYTSCLNYGKPEKGHRANGFTTDGGFAEYAINHINTLARVPGTMSDAEATLVVTAGTSMYGLTELGGLVAGESVVNTHTFPWQTYRQRSAMHANGSMMPSRWLSPTVRLPRSQARPNSWTQRPSNFGSRFSMKALMPSCVSAVLNSGSSCR